MRLPPLIRDGARGRRSHALALALVATAVPALVPATAEAFPGANGKIAFESNRGTAGDFEILSMNSDGSGQTNLTNRVGNDNEPAWSPDGTRIALSSNRTGDRESSS